MVFDQHDSSVVYFGGVVRITENQHYLLVMDGVLGYSREDVEMGEWNDNSQRRDYISEINNVVDASASTDYKNHRLTFGGDVRKAELDNPRDLLGSGKDNIRQEALFVQDEWTMAEDWTLTFGARMDHHEKFGTEFSPRAYLVNSVTDNLTVKGGVGQAFKAPTMLQLNDGNYSAPSKGWLL